LGSEYQWFVGVDWGGERHQVCVLDGRRRLVGGRAISHSGEGLAELTSWLSEIVAGEPATMAAALEVPHGALVETLLAHGFAVFSINPKQLDRFRDRHTISGAKDDRRDAFVLAASMVTDLHAYREVKSESAFVVRICELSRTASEFDKERRRLCNQLRELLFRYFPAALRIMWSCRRMLVVGFVVESAFSGESGEVEADPG
jgi:Transposase